MPPKDVLDLDSSFFLEKKQLVNLKTEAMHLHKAPKRIDRVLFDLAIKVSANIRSRKLAKCIFTFTMKLDTKARSFASRLMGINVPLAHRTSLAAQKLGNRYAKKGSLILHSRFSWLLLM